MDDARAALALWGLEDAAASSPMFRENTVYRVEDAAGAYALRLHRPGLRSESELRSELAWMAMLAAKGLAAPAPRPTLDGDLIARSGGAFVSLLTWLPGDRFGAAGAPLALDDPEAAFAALGAEMARLHTLSDDWTPPAGFDRPRWDAEGLLGEEPLWGRFWDAPFLSPADRALFMDARAAMRDALHGQKADFGLIHADLLRENVLLHDGRPQLIDFDDSGWGYRLFDIATSLVKHQREAIYPAIKSALLEGYAAHRPVDAARLPLFLALRAFTYVGWIADRLDEPGAAERVTRNVAEARQTARACLREIGA